MIVSLSLAAALHAGVLFGFRRGAVPHPPPRAIADYIRLEMRPEAPEPEERIASEEKSPAPDLSPLRRSEDIPVMNPDPRDFQQRIVPAVDVDRPVATLQNVNFDPMQNAAKRFGDALSLRDLENTPRARVQIAPPYPFEAKREGLSGRVLVEFIVDESGHVIEPRIVESSNPVFNDTTLRTLLRWRFDPGRKLGRNVRFRMALPLEFNLNEN